MYDSKQYKILHQQKKNLPFHFEGLKIGNKPGPKSANTEVVRSRISIDPKNAKQTIGFDGPHTHTVNPQFEALDKTIKRNSTPKSDHQIEAKFLPLPLRNLLVKDDSKDTISTGGYPLTDLEISRESTYSSMPSDWSNLETVDSSISQPTRRRSDTVDSFAFTVDSLDDHDYKDGDTRNSDPPSDADGDADYVTHDQYINLVANELRGQLIIFLPVCNSFALCNHLFILFHSGCRGTSEESQVILRRYRRLNNETFETESEESSNLMTMKRLSFPNYNLTQDNKLTPPFMEPPLLNHNNYSHFGTAATKFGPVIKGLRKPGHHIPGPARNPHCTCDHCRRYFEKQQEPEIGRARAFSLGNANSFSSSHRNYHNNRASVDGLNII